MSSVTTDDLYALCARAFERADCNWAEIEGDKGLLVSSEDDQAIHLFLYECLDASEQPWPLIGLIVNVLEDVTVDSLSDRIIATLGEQLLCGRVALVGESLQFQHEIVGWPGSAELFATMEIVLAGASLAREQLSKSTRGSRPTPFSELVDD